MVEFQEFPKIPRLNRDVCITEKIDGTNGCVVVEDEVQPKAWYDWWSEPRIERKVYAQSRNRLLTPDNDNAGFAKWVKENAEELKQLGPGYHYGEWWGQKIGRNYGLKEKRFSLFNSWRWVDERATGTIRSAVDLEPGRGYCPPCCSVVPILPFHTLQDVPAAIEFLKQGSLAAPGFKDPEGIIVFHTAASKYFKVTIKGDESPKGKKNEAAV
jgi:RNA ligase